MYLWCYLNTDTKLKSCAGPQRSKPDCPPSSTEPVCEVPGAALFSSSPPASPSPLLWVPGRQARTADLFDTAPWTRLRRQNGVPGATGMGGGRGRYDGGGTVWGRNRGHVPGPRRLPFPVLPGATAGSVRLGPGRAWPTSLYLTVYITVPALFPAGGT